MAHMDTPETQRANRRYMKSAMTVPLLDERHEFELARRWKEQKDEHALHELTRAYMRLVISLATRFEPDRGVRFSTYASWWIRAAIQDYILRNWSIVRTGTTAAHKSLFFNLRRLRALIANGTRQNLTEEDRIFIAKRLGVGIQDVETIDARLTSGDRSLNAAVADSTSAESTTEWQDLTLCDRPLPDEEVMESHDGRQRSRWIESALESLNERELIIIRQRRLRDEAVTLETLGAQLGISKERVRQIEHAALRKLRDALLSKVPNPEEAGLLA